MQMHKMYHEGLFFHVEKRDLHINFKILSYLLYLQIIFS